MSEAPSRVPVLFTVFLVVLIDLIGFGIVLPLLPFYAAQFHASAFSIGLLYSIYSFAQLIFSPLWGRLSDRIGRRPIMLISTFGSCFAYLLFGLSHSLALLFFSRLLAGIMGGNISAAQACVADVTTHSERAKGMGLIGAAFGIGFVLGPALSAALVHLPVQNRYAAPGFFASFLSFTSFLLVLFRLPETAQKSVEQDSSRITRFSIFNVNFWTSLREEGRIRKLLPALFLSIFLLSFGQSSLYSAFPLFCGTVLNLTADRVGILFVIMGLVAVVIQGGLIRTLEKRFGERRLFLAGSALMVCGLALIPFAKSEKELMLFLIVMAVGGSLNGPTLSSMISKEAHPGQTGAVLGSSQGLAALGRALGPTWGGLLFGVSFKLPFVVTAALLCLTLWVGFKIDNA